MLRFKSNCRTIEVEPRELEEVISVIPAIRPNCRSSGVATADAIVSGLAPGSFACTLIVGKSTCGNGETGRKEYATIPARATAIVSRVVAIGLRIKGAEIHTRPAPVRVEIRRFRRACGPDVLRGGQRQGKSPAWCRVSATG